MHQGGSHNGSLEDQLSLVVVDSPDLAAPLIGALEVADFGAWMWVEGERALYFSPHVIALLGIALEPRADLLVRFLHGVHPDDQDEIDQLLRRERPAGRFKLRYRFAPPDGPLRWIEDRGRVERDAAGQLVRQGGAIREVTHEVGREQERREADARLEALVNAMPFAVWGCSGQNLEVTHQNATSIETWGDIHGRTLSEAPGELRTHWEHQLAEVLSGQIIRARHDQTWNGNRRVIHEIIAPVVVENRVTGAVGVAVDVTEEARAAQFAALLTEISADFASRSSHQLDTAVKSSLEKIARFLGAPIAALFEVAEEGSVQVTHWWMDPATGVKRPGDMQFHSGPLRGLFRRLAENTPILIRSLDELPGGSAERMWLAERRYQSFAIVPAQHSDAGTQTILGLAGRPDEVLHWPDDTIPSLRLAATLLSGVLTRARAEAHQRTVERSMQEAQKLESLGVLAGGIAHDFNNLLTAILGHASLLRAEFDGPTGFTDSLDQIESASRRAAELCRQMLAYAGRGRFALQTLDLNWLIREMQALLQVTVPKKSTLELALAPSLPPILADETQIRQVIMNLVINASEALHEGTGTITIATSYRRRSAQELSQTVFSPQLSEGDYVSLTVSDTGEGMTAETTARIFDPFFSTKFTGRGLGLAAVVGIVRAHQGALNVRSHYGAGSTFELIVPAHEGRATPPPEAISPVEHATLAGWQTTGTVLVVDDEHGVRDLVRRVLERAGLTVIVCQDGQKGVDAFRQIAGKVRLVLLDLTMPQLDGREALAAMRAIREDVSAILMSGYSPDDLIHASNHAFLQKPFTPAALRGVVKRVLEGQAPQSADADNAPVRRPKHDAS